MERTALSWKTVVSFLQH